MSLPHNFIRFIFSFSTIQAPAPQTPIPVPTGKPRADTPKAAGQRTLPPIMPSSSGANTPTPIRPASSVSTQTAVGASPATTVQAGTTRPAVS